MLGVAPDASHDEVRRAYTARALRLHPDRQAHATLAELERAEWKMKELNAAWEVLRDPARRRAYDQGLGLAGGGTDVRGAGGVHVPSGRPRDLTEDLPEPEPVRGTAGDGTAGDGAPVALPRLVRYAPLVVILVVLAAILVLSALVAPDPDGDPDVVTTEAVPVGSCVQLQPAVSEEPGEPAGTPFVVEVDCSLANAGEVVDKVPFPTPCPPGTVNVPVPADGISLCLRPAR